MREYPKGGHTIRINPAILGTVASFALVFSAVPAQADSDSSLVPTQAVKVPITVSVPISTIRTPGTGGSNGIVEIVVGRSAPLSVMLDTGSVGLRLWSGSHPSMRISNKKINASVGGLKIPGFIGSAPVTLNGVSTTLDVPFQYINTDNPYIDQWKRIGVSGILGIGVGTGDLTNPLVALPGDLGLHWSVHFSGLGIGAKKSGALILGARAPANANMFFQLPPAGSNVNGALLWDDHAANGCWKFGRQPEMCVPTWFDSGFTVMRVKGRQFSRLPTASANQLRPGTRVTLSVPTSSFIGDSFVAGSSASRNLVRVIDSGRATINTGNSVYFEYTVTYNVATGGIYLYKPLPKKG